MQEACVAERVLVVGDAGKAAPGRSNGGQVAVADAEAVRWIAVKQPVQERSPGDGVLHGHIADVQQPRQAHIYPRCRHASTISSTVVVSDFVISQPG